MATRILIVAVLDSSPEAFREAFPKLPDPEVCGRWTWGAYSLWGVSPSSLDPSTLETPVLLITTSDDEEWTLLLRGAGQQEFGVVCHHAYLEPGIEEDDEEEDYEDEEEEGDDGDEDDSLRAWLTSGYEYRGRDVWPSTAVRPLAELSWTEGLPRFFRLQARETADALGKAGLPFDRERLTHAFLGEGLPERDWDRPTGNLCAFLDELGLTLFGYERGGDEPEDDEVGDAAQEEEANDEAGADEETTDDAVEEERSDETEPDPDRGNPVKSAEAILEASSTLASHAVESGPVALPLEHFILAYLLLQVCDDDAVPALELLLPDGEADAVDWPRHPRVDDDEDESDYRGAVIREDGRTLVCLGPNAPYRFERWCRVLGPAMKGLPEGTTLRLHAARTHLMEGADNRRHPKLIAGTLRGGEWLIDRTWLALTADVLRDGLDVTRCMEDELPFQARDEDEALAVLWAVERGPSASILEIPRLADDLRLAVDGSHELLPVARHLLEVRHGDVFSHLVSQFDELCRRNYPPMPRRSQEPVHAEGEERLVFRGELTTYRHPTEDFLAEQDAPVLPSPRDEREREFLKVVFDFEPEPVSEEELDPGNHERVAGLMKELGFEPLGPLVTDLTEGGLIRLFTSAACPHVVGIHYQGKYVVGLAVEFCTSFEGGVMLSTSRRALPERAHRGTFRRHVEGGTPRQVWEEHLVGLELHARRGRKVVELEPSLEGMARVMDAAMMRQNC
ncbi:MAG: hypothetical protein AAF533_10765 [Acidobacteriota bacterium]